MSKKLALRETGELLLAAQNIVLCSHVSPDGDTLGSTLGLMRQLDKLGKTVKVLLDDDIPRGLSFLPGIEHYRRPEAGNFIEADLLVVLDASSFDRIGLVGEVVKAPLLLNIDHHISNTEYADLLYIDAKAAATGEIICDLCQEMGWEYDEQVAVCLYTAISTDCGSFRYSNTTRKTMVNAAQLLDYGVRPNEIADCLDTKSRATMELLSRILPSLTFACEGRVAYLSIPNSLYDKNVETDSFVSYPRYIEGVEVAILFKAIETNVTRVSMRSSSIDVAAVAVSFGGGGHLRAAGCTIYASLEDARKQLLEKLGEVL